MSHVYGLESSYMRIILKVIVYLERPYVRIILKYDRIIWSFHCIQLKRPENTVSYS